MARPALIALKASSILASLAIVGLLPTVWAHATAGGHLATTGGAPAGDVALVLGAKVEPNGQPSSFLAGRLEVARQLYANGKVRALLVSGDNSKEHYNEPDAMKRWLVAHGVPADKVVTDYAGFDTYDSCVRARQIFGVSKAAVVTQGYHLPRAVATCRAVGVDATGVGDESVREHYLGYWLRGEARELAAGWKMTYDLLSHRTPVLGNVETGVSDALR